MPLFFGLIIFITLTKHRDMKKIIIITTVLLGIYSAKAQGEFRIGLHGGIPLGDAANVADFVVAIDAAYLYNINPAIDVGFATGFSNSFVGDSTIDIGPIAVNVKGEDFQFIPVAGAFRYRIGTKFFIGADIGYAIGVNPEGNNGGFYYAPRAQYAVSDLIDLVAAYRGISLTNGSWNSISAGIEFKLN